MMQGIKDYTVKIDRNGGKVVEVGKTVLDNYDRGMSIFKIAKVAASPSAWMNAVVGNMLMTHMATGSISPRFMKRLAESQALYRNKTGKAALFDSLMMDAGGKEDVVRRYLAENPTAARGTLGDISYIGNPITGKKGLAEYTTERVLMNGHDAGIVSSAVTAEQIKPEMVDALAEIAAERDVKMARAQAEHNMKAAETVLPDKSGVAMTKEAIAAAKKSGQNLSRFDIGTGMMSQELFNDRVQREMFDWMANKAKENPGNMAYKLLDFTFNKMPEGYEKIDQAYKMATFMTATRDGYTLNELRGIRHLVDVNPEELTKTIQEGQYLYKLHPRTAIELANVMYLNYAAMPAAVRVLRNIPVLRSPFISFMYGMTLKTGQTLAYNPSAFNKVTFALNDFGGLKTPLEKKALDTKFYSYLKQPGMVRLPDFLNFFDKNPVYANLSSMIPYYSLNMFNPSQAQYDAGARGKIMEIAQKSSLMSDPLGSVLLNYLIQPLILGSATQPQGQFGQPLYPVDATGLEKVGYAARTFGESMVPNIYSYAGLVTPESLAEYVPSYRWKQLARAKEGLNPLGISSKESKLSRTTRGVLQTSGIPIQAPVNTSFSQQQ